MVLLGSFLFVLFLHFVNQYFLIRDIHLNIIGDFFDLSFSFSLSYVLENDITKMHGVKFII